MGVAQSTPLDLVLNHLQEFLNSQNSQVWFFLPAMQPSLTGMNGPPVAQREGPFYLPITVYEPWSLLDQMLWALQLLPLMDGQPGPHALFPLSLTEGISVLLPMFLFLLPLLKPLPSQPRQREEQPLSPLTLLIPLVFHFTLPVLPREQTLTM